MSLTWQLLHGDVRDRLKDLPAGSVQCVVTSPPYWGLRDYGTATWEGGDPACDHKTGRFTRGGLSSKQASNHGSGGDEAKRDCHCGAVRIDNQLGLEPTPDGYVQGMVSVFAEVWRVLRDDGVVWLNLGDSYNAGRDGGHPGGKFSGFQQIDERYVNRSGANVAGLKPKDLVGIPWRVAFALQAAGWYLRSDIIWSKRSPMPESVTDRPTRSHEYIFLLTKNARYYYDAEAIAEPATGLRTGGFSDSTHAARRAAISGGVVSDVRGESWATRNKRSVWTISSQPYPDAHFATFPEALVEPCILAGSKPGDLILDPFCGSGTTGAVSIRLQRNFVGIELNSNYIELARKRIGNVAPLLAQEIA